MENVASKSWDEAEATAGSELRNAPRFTLLIRAARLVTPQGEFVCVIRDVSETGVSVRLFHALPKCDQIALHMPGGQSYDVRTVWSRNNEAGFEFAQSVEVTQIINEASEYPKRGLRLQVHFPISATTLTENFAATVENFSQQGARLECDRPLAIDQSLRISCKDSFTDVRAKVRWRRDRVYGLVFDDTFTLGDFARLAAQLQAPDLLSG